MNPINDFTVDESYIKMLNSFNVNSLKALLSAFKQNIAGRKSELKNQAIELLRTTPPSINYFAFTTKIYEIYRCLPHNMRRNDIILRRSPQRNTPEHRHTIPSTSQAQNSQQRMCQPQQLPQHSTHMNRTGSPPVMPQRQINNNISHTAAEPTETNSTVTIYYYQSFLSQPTRNRKYPLPHKVKPIDLTLSDDEEPPTKKDKQEN